MKKEFTYDSRDGLTQIHAVSWAPDTVESVRPRAIVQIVHGMAEYVERYDAFARYLTEHNIVVVGNDHLGHGKSVAEGKPTGYFCREDPATVVVRDVHRLKKLTEEHYRGVPYLIFGHSMGSFVTRDYMTRYGTGIAGAIIQGTGYQSASLAKLGKTVAGIQRVFTGDLHRSGLLNVMSFGSYLKKIHPVRTQMDWLSYNEKNVDDYLADPLLGFTFTVNGFATLMDLVLRSGDVSRMKRIPRELPVYLCSGEDDPVGDYGEAVRKLCDIYRDTLQMQDVTMKLYPHMRHEILMEDGAETVYEEYLRWIGERWKDM